MNKEVYNLALTTSNLNSNVDNNPIIRTAGNYADVTWLVNFDQFIPQEKLDQYKFCRVRFSFIQGPQTFTWNNQIGYLAINLQSDFNAPTTILPTILGMLYPITDPNTRTADQVYIITTLDQIGVDININSLRGRQFLNIKLCNDDSYSLLANITNDYEICLFFELYN